MFSKNLDDLLWCILESDNENRGQIVDFLKRLPDQTYIAVDRLLTLNKNNKTIEFLDGVQGKIYKCQLINSHGEQTLIIRESLFQPKHNINVNFCRELTLSKSLEHFENLEAVLIGNFTYIVEVEGATLDYETIKKVGLEPYINLEDLSETIEHYEKERDYKYSLVSDFTPYVIRTVNGDNQSYVNVDIEQIPSELSLEYIEKRYSGDPESLTR